MIRSASSPSPGGQQRGIVDEPREDRVHDVVGAPVLGPDLRAEVDAVEHERAQREHRLADLVALADVAGPLRGLDEVVDERVDPLRAGRAEQLDLRARQVGVREDPVADRVVDVVVDVGDAVDDAHDLPLERLRLLRARVGEDPVADLVGEVEPAGDPPRLLVVAEAAPERGAERVVERLLARVAERRVARVVPEADRLDEVLVEPQRARDDARDRGRLERVGHPGAVVVALGVDEDLRLPLQPPERLRVHEAVAVALERRPDAARLLGLGPAAGLERADGERREPRLLVRAHALLERFRGAACDVHALEGSRASGFRPSRAGALRTTATARRRP